MNEVRQKSEPVKIFNTRNFPVRLHTLMKRIAAERRITMERAHTEALEEGLKVLEARIIASQNIGSL